MKPLIPAALLLLTTFAAALPKDRFDGAGGPPPQAAEQEAPAPVAGEAVFKDDRLWVVVKAGGKEARNAVVDAGVSIEEVLPGLVSGVATPASLARLAAAGLAVEKATPLSKAFRAFDFPKEDASFHNYKETSDELKALAQSARDLASLISIGKSVNGRDLWGVRLNATESGDQPSRKPGIVFLGTHHAREHLSTEVPLLLARYLIENRAKPEIAKLLASRDIYIIPMINPDGVEYDISGGKYHMQRKNLRPNGDGSTGVDLNRNYGFHWAEGGASNDPGSDIYHGPSAFSEPETQAVRAFVGARPNLRILLSFHTFSELILYPWGHSNDPIPDAKALAAYKAMAKTMAGWNGYTPEQSSDLYIASGDTTDWSWGVHKIFSFTFELTPKSMWGGGFYPGAAAIATTFQANIKPALYLIDLADDPYRAAGSPDLTLSSKTAPSGGR